MLVPNGREEEEALEIERVLLKRLQAGIDRKVPCSGRIKKSKETLEQQMKDPMDSKTRARFRKRLHDLNNLLADSNSIFDHLNPCLCYSLKQMTEEHMESAQNQTSKPQTATPKERPPQERPLSSPMKAVEPCGLKIDGMAVENLLLHRTANEEDFNAVGILGSEGVGKTTLAQVIFHNDKVKSRFLPRIWVSLSDDLSHGESAEIVFAQRILLALGFDHEAINEMKRTNSDQESFHADLICAIRSELTRKRYLIVLDGAPPEGNGNGWYVDLPREASPGMEKKLAYALPKGNGGAVLVTGRAESTVKKMIGGDGIHRLLPLDNPELCWHIYLKAAGEKEDSTRDKEEMRKVKDEVVKRCSGHPAAAVLMGEIRKMQTSSEKCWSDFFARENDNNISKDKEDIMKELKRCNGNTIAARKISEERRGLKKTT